MAERSFFSPVEGGRGEETCFFDVSGMAFISDSASTRHHQRHPRSMCK